MELQRVSIRPAIGRELEKEPGNLPVPADPPAWPEIDACDLLLAVAKHKKQILGASLSLGALVGLISLGLPNMYTGTTRILPPQQTQSMASAMIGQLGALGNLAGHDLGLKNPNDVYVAMLASRTAGDALIRRFDLMRRYHSKSLGKARKELEERTTILNGKDGIISILVEDEDPKGAADISNAYVEELSNLSRTVAVNEASQRRLFYENQLKLAKEQLSNAETALRATQESTGLICLEEEPPSVPIEEALGNSRMVLGVASAALIEAWIVGCKVIHIAGGPCRSVLMDRYQRSANVYYCDQDSDDRSLDRFLAEPAVLNESEQAFVNYLTALEERVA